MDTIINNFDSISLDEMSGVKLMNRVDTKFVTTMPRLIKLLKMAQSDYFIQEIDGKRASAYTTLYYDTPALDMYLTHHNGCLGRQKVRVRQYVDSGLTFLEVKVKNNHRRTRKKRISISDFNIEGDEKHKFLEPLCWYDVDTLKPSLRNWFNRMTLVNKGKTERVTIDTDLRYHNIVTGVDNALEQAVIIEVKRDGNVPSPLLVMLRDLRIQPHGFSKYCIGTALTNEKIKQNRLKEKIYYVHRLIERDA
ncbi:MAG: polyphosphate polymerase domain-containing protein [Muribaculaceae bacterium]|nr:polyphosphate polymerase domain-containing protein [Muribaculaceae bacterium]